MITRKKKVVASSNKVIQKNYVKAEDEVLEDVVDDTFEDVAVEIEPEATELLFEAEDVAELVAEVTGKDVEVAVNDDDTVDFTIGEDTFTVSAEGNEEILEASKKVLKKGILASKKKARVAARKVR